MSMTREEWLQSLKIPPKTPKLWFPRVSSHLTQVDHFKECYSPKLVSIGPYYKSNGKFMVTDEMKGHAALLLSGSQQMLQDVMNSLHARIKELRDCYDSGAPHFTDEDFCRMLVLDGCFISGGAKLMKMSQHESLVVKTDLLLMENQIPFSVLRDIIYKLPDPEIWESKFTDFMNSAVFSAKVPTNFLRAPPAHVFSKSPNLIAFEERDLCNRHMWVTAYFALLNSLVKNVQDVQILRMTGVLDIDLGGDQEVMEFIHDINKHSTAADTMYKEVKHDLQVYFQSDRKTVVGRIMHDYMKTKIRIVGLSFALLALIFSAIQTVMSVKK